MSYGALKKLVELLERVATGQLRDTFDRKNRKAFATYGLLEFAENQVEVFGPDGSHLPREEVRTQIRKHLAGCYESARFRSWAKIEF